MNVQYEMISKQCMVRETMMNLAAMRVDIDGLEAGLSLRDSRKLYSRLKVIKSSLAAMGRGNSDRLLDIMRAIDKVSKLSDQALDGGADLRDRVINHFWLVYSKVEMHGTDNAHWIESDIPCDDRNRITTNKRGAYGSIYYQPQKRTKRIMVDSQYSPQDQYTILSAYDLFR